MGPYQSAYVEHKTVRKAAKAMGIARSTFHDRLQAEIKKSQTIQIPVVQNKRTFASVTESPNPINELLKQNEVNLDQYEIVSAAHSLMASGKYSTRVNIKPRHVDWFEICSRKIEELKNRSPLKPQEYYYSTPDGNLVAELSIHDAHIGKLCWEKETGEDYDIEIAVRRYKDTVDQAVERVKDLPIKKWWYITGSDFFHIDNIRNETTAGTPQDVDTRMSHMFDCGVELCTYAIERMLEVADVETIHVPGNHDFCNSLFLAKVLNAYYNGNNRVSIDTSPRTRKYTYHGKVLIQHTHGDKGKDLALTMATEVPDLWANSSYREIHKGHFHTRKIEKHQDVNTEKGVVIRTLPSLSGDDFWHAQNAYVGNTKAADMYLWEESGLFAQHELRGR